jgi:hypothetical protein
MGKVNQLNLKLNDQDKDVLTRAATHMNTSIAKFVIYAARAYLTKQGLPVPAEVEEPAAPAVMPNAWDEPSGVPYDFICGGSIPLLWDEPEEKPDYKFAIDQPGFIPLGGSKEEEKL